MKTWMIASIAVFSLAIASLVYAQPGPGRAGGDSPGFQGQREGRQGGPDRGRMIERLIENDQLASRLGITEDQVNALREVYYANQESMIRLKAEKDMADLEARRLMKDEGAELGTVLAAVEKAGEKGIEIRKNAVEMQFKVREILGEETLNAIRDNARKQMQEGRGKGQGRGDGERPQRQGKRDGERGRPDSEGDGRE